nr:hypothetical protein [Microcystis aeruginosa]
MVINLDSPLILEENNRPPVSQLLEFLLSSHAKLITCPIELKPLRGNDRHV